MSPLEQFNIYSLVNHLFTPPAKAMLSIEDAKQDTLLSFEDELLCMLRSGKLDIKTLKDDITYWKSYRSNCGHGLHG